MLILVLGLPVVVTLAWYHGERASRNFTQAEISILSALLVVASLLFYVFVRPTGEAVSSPELRQAGVTAALSAASDPHSAISVAVLPFVNLSSDKEQEFFSDGMTEEITSALAKVPKLRVVGRTSAFQFKGENKDLRAIGQALSATHLLEGSVRKDGNQLRITAQLVKADDGTHVWQAIAGALRVPLGLKLGESLVSSRAIDPDSYQQYLRIRAAFRGRTGNALIVANLEQLVVHDPEFAPAWGLLAAVYMNSAPGDLELWSRPVEETHRLLQSTLDKAERAAREAVRLDPREVRGYAVLANIEGYRKNWAARDDLYRQALALDPNDSDTLISYGVELYVGGRLNEGLRLMEQVRAMDPFIPVNNFNIASAMLVNGHTDAATAMLEAELLLPAAPAGNRAFRSETLARAYAAAGRFSEAADTILAIPKTRYGDSGKSIEDAARLMRAVPAKVSAPAALPDLPGRLNFVYSYVGAPDRVLDFPERALEAGSSPGNGLRLLWDPRNAPVFKTERFKTLVRKWGLVDYWRQRGWPDRCRAQGVDDFVCE